MLPEIAWAQFDLVPLVDVVVQRDCIVDFPTGYDVCITNPPFVSKSFLQRYNVPALAPGDENFYDVALRCLLSKLCVRGGIAATVLLSSKEFPETPSKFDILSKKNVQGEDSAPVSSFFSNRARSI
jgi:hypothetical protein